MPPYTSGFANMPLLVDHFTRHASLLGIYTATYYEQMADDFMGNPNPPPEVVECIRAREGDKIRYNPHTEEWGVLSSANVIRTYYILTTAIIIHGSGMNYFHSECAKI